MKIDFLRKLLAKLKKNDVEVKQNKEQFTGYNADTTNLAVKEESAGKTTMDRIPSDGFTRLTENGIEVVGREQVVNEVYRYIQDFLIKNAQIIPKCNVTESEWKCFLEIAYNHFVAYNLQSGYSNLMQVSINYIFYEQYLYDTSVITFKDVIEKFNISFLPPGVADGLAENIRKEVYLTTRKDNVVDFLEFQNIRKGR